MKTIVVTAIVMVLAASPFFNHDETEQILHQITQKTGGYVERRDQFEGDKYAVVALPGGYDFDRVRNSVDLVTATTGIEYIREWEGREETGYIAVLELNGVTAGMSYNGDTIMFMEYGDFRG